MGTSDRSLMLPHWAAHRLWIVLAMAALLATSAVACTTAPRDDEGKRRVRYDASDALDRARENDPTLDAFLADSHAFAVFPKVAKGGAGVGGAYGHGVLYERDRFVGYCDVSQGSIGFQLGGQVYTLIVVFENANVLGRFKTGNLEFAAQASAVAVRSGAGANAEYTDGVAVFTMNEEGLMYEASIGGQRFTYEPAE